MNMKANHYLVPLCEFSELGQQDLLCSSYTSADRELDSLTDASSDWDLID